MEKHLFFLNKNLVIDSTLLEREREREREREHSYEDSRNIFATPVFIL